MTRFRNVTSSLLVALAFAAWPASARAATINAAVNANVVKPLALTAKQDLDFGQIIIAGGAGTRTVSISPAGALTCGAGLTCTGAVRPAIFNVRGTNNQVVRISAVPSNLVNGTATLVFTPTAQATVTLTSSGAPGNDFNVGGSIAVSSTTLDGIYTGTIEVTVDY